MSNKSGNKVGARAIAASLVVAAALARASQGMEMDNEEVSSYNCDTQIQIYKNPFTLQPIKLDAVKWYPKSAIPKGVHVLESLNLSEENLLKFGEDIKSNGIFMLKNHQILDELIEKYINVHRKFFNLHKSQKDKYKKPGMFRGYSGYQEQSVETLTDNANRGNGDTHISFYWGPHTNEAPNQEFEEISQQLYDELNNTSKKLTEIIIKALGIEDTLTGADFNNGEHLLKIQEFVEDPEASSQPHRIAPHVDISFFTINIQMPAANGYVALEGEINGEYVPIPAVKGHMVVFFGEPAHSITNGLIPPLLHRVVSPTKENYKGSSRTSMPFFYAPNPEVELIPYEGSTYEQYYNTNGKKLYGEFFKNATSGFKK